MFEYPKFTVIIPQKNRAEYLEYTLKTCMIQDYPNFEVIVSDDCSEDGSVALVKEYAERDNRIKLFAHKKHLGMRDNFEFALNQVRDGYVMALGGDDGLVPGCIWKMYNILKETGKELLTWTPATFSYPSVGQTQNLICIRRRHNNGIRFIKSKDFLQKISTDFWYLNDECPMFYIKGVASLELVNKVKSRTTDGSFYYCPTPDGFSGVVLAGEVDEYAFTFEPLSIGGGTDKSQGRNYMRSDEKSKFEANQFFNDNIRRTMHPLLASQPYSPLITLMTADYLLTAKDLNGWPGIVPDISFEQLIIISFKRIETLEFTNEVLVRELKILREIAIQHNLLELYNNLYKTTQRRVVRAPNIMGLAFTNSIRIEGSKYGIHNVYDAALAIPFIYNFYNKTKLKDLFCVVYNMIKIVLRQRKYKIERLPDI